MPPPTAKPPAVQLSSLTLCGLRDGDTLATQRGGISSKLQSCQAEGRLEGAEMDKRCLQLGAGFKRTLGGHNVEEGGSNLGRQGSQGSIWDEEGPRGTSRYDSRVPRLMYTLRYYGIFFCALSHYYGLTLGYGLYRSSIIFLIKW